MRYSIVSGSVDIPTGEQSPAAKGISLPFLALVCSLGVAGSFQPLFITAGWFFIGFAIVYGFLNNRIGWLWYGFAASPGMEVLGRMSKAPLVPYESGKYFVLLCIMLLLWQHVMRASNKPTHKVGAAILLLLLPSIIVALPVFNADQWIFNLLGIIELAAMLIFISRERWDIEFLCRTLQYAVLPIICIVIYLTIQTPDLNKVSFVLRANTDTAGGFGSNQVSTILGFGILITVVLLILKRPLFSFRWANYVLLAYMSYRGLLTFSRGGILTALLAIFVLLLPSMLSSRRNAIRYSIMYISLGLVSYVVFNKVNQLTGNKLLLRYQGETRSTLEGREKTLNSVSSGRFDIARTDIYMFAENPMFGVGPGISKLERPRFDVSAVAAHTESSRLMAEHGTGGLLVVVMLLAFPIVWVMKQKYALWKGVSGALFVFAFVTTTHSATRTNTAIIAYTLAAIPLYYTMKKNDEG